MCCGFFGKYPGYFRAFHPPRFARRHSGNSWRRIVAARKGVQGGRRRRRAPRLCCLFEFQKANRIVIARSASFASLAMTTRMQRVNSRRVGKGALAPCPPMHARCQNGGHASHCPPYGISHASAFSRHELPEGWCVHHPSSIGEGAGKTGCWLHPWVPCNKKHGVGPQVQPERPGLPCAMVLRLMSCSPRCPGFSSHRPPGLLTRGLIPTSGDQDHTISPSAAAAPVSRSLCVHRIPPQRS